MLTLNADTKQKITLQALYEIPKKLADLIHKDDGNATFISELNTIFIYFKDVKKACGKKLQRHLLCFFTKNKYNLNIDVESFYKIGGCNTLEIISETILYANHHQYSKKKDDKHLDLKFNLICQATEDTKGTHQAILDESKIEMEFVNFARDLQDMPPNECYSLAMADKIVEKAATIKRIKATVLTESDIKKAGMNLVLAVNAGSKHEPRVVILEYVGDPHSKKKLGLIGKGVTFDTGGYNLKPSMYMKGMKFDMSGAAIASSTLMAIAKAKLKVNAVSVACIVDNAIGAKGTLPESIIKSLNGKTVQIDNTDAEGRLILADGITHAIRTLKVSNIIELSTLTGGIVIALGTKITGTYSNCDKMFCRFQKAACHSREDIWRMPLHRDFDQMITTTPVADIANVGKTPQGSANQAAAFLKQFMEDKPFIHLDIAGTATTADQRGRGVMVRTIFHYCELLEKGDTETCQNK